MTDHEKAAMEAAKIAAPNPHYHDSFGQFMWSAGRAYEPPAVCGALRNANNVCALTEGHDGDHRAPLHLGGYFGWPREPEPDSDEWCALKIPRGAYDFCCNVRRKNHRVCDHAFVSAKEATK